MLPSREPNPSDFGKTVMCLIKILSYFLKNLCVSGILDANFNSSTKKYWGSIYYLGDLLLGNVKAQKSRGAFGLESEKILLEFQMGMFCLDQIYKVGWLHPKSEAIRPTE